MSGGEPGVTFAQTGGYQPTCYSCKAKGHTVNECPKLDKASKDKLWAAFKLARGGKRKRGIAHAAVVGNAAVASVPAPAPAPSPAAAASVAGVSETSEEFEKFQGYMELVKATDNMSLGFAQVGTVCEKKVSFAFVQDKPDNVLRLNRTTCI